MIQTILITGAGGLLGTEVINQLLEEKDVKLIALTSQVKSLRTKYKDNVTVFPNDNWKKEVMDRKIQIDTILNCAFPRSSKPDELAKGIPFTEKLVKESIEIGVKNFVNISSQSVYSQKQKETPTEQTAVQPENLYGMTKYACERIVSLLCEQNGIKYTNIRLASLTSPNFDVRMTNRFVKSVVKGRTIQINGGQQQLSFLDVRDAARALILLLKQVDKCWSPIYNLGNKEIYILLDLIELIILVSEEFDYPKVKLDIQEGDSNYNNVIDSGLFYLHHDFKIKFSFEVMIKELFQIYREEYKGE